MKSKRTLKPEFKFQVVLKTLQREASQAEIARQYDVHPQLLSAWRRQLLLEGPNIFALRKEDRRKDQKVEELEKLIGRQTIEIQFLKKVLGHLG